jgi:hypothetical protein
MRSSLARLPLPLFMLRVGADHPHHAAAVNDLAVVAHLLNRCPDFHYLLFLVVMQPSCRENAGNDKRLF